MKAIELNFPFEKIDEIAEVESYRKEINRPIYHIHKWWGKRLGSVFRAIVSGALAEKEWPDFYAYQNCAGKVVLDPFMGSGTTLGEAIKLGAKVIGCDVNPVSTFMVRQALMPVNLNQLETEFREIERDVKEEIQSYYTTKVPTSNKSASVGSSTSALRCVTSTIRLSTFIDWSSASMERSRPTNRGMTICG